MQVAQFVSTREDRCRVCYTCVRECPAKAIRIQEGQAKVVGERCISCGNCVKVCSQGAKEITSTIEQVQEILREGGPVAACVAPSFPAEFGDVETAGLVSALRELGFKYVVDVAFGADLVAREYKSLLQNNPDKQYVASTCPAVVGYVQRYHPDLVNQLAPVVSPMVATARSIRAIYGDRVRCVFIGPCVAKKEEASQTGSPRDVDVAITFAELRKLLDGEGVSAAGQPEQEWDAPLPGTGALFPITGGLLQAAGIDESLLAEESVAADGLAECTEAILEFSTGDLKTQLLELLFCNGCIMGPGMTSSAPLFKKRSSISRYARQRVAQLDKEAWEQCIQDVKPVDLSTSFEANDQRLRRPESDRIAQILRDMGKTASSDELNCGACGYITCRAHAEAIEKGLAESEMCLPFVIEEMKSTVDELTVSHEKLADAQQQLMQSEKLASMGQLAAGVAHELNNPLGVVLMYSHLLLDETERSSELYDDLKMIAEQADRGKKIVANLLDFARENKVFIEPADITDLIQSSIASVKVPVKNAVSYSFKHNAKVCDLDRDQMTQVLTNLYTNAFAAMEQTGGRLEIITSNDDTHLNICVADTGMGIASENLDRVFQPFFTTKAIGKGTGLGLAVVYGIIKMHKGDIRVVSNADPGAGPTGCEFHIKLPLEGGA